MMNTGVGTGVGGVPSLGGRGSCKLFSGPSASLLASQTSEQPEVHGQACRWQDPGQQPGQSPGGGGDGYQQADVSCVTVSNDNHLPKNEGCVWLISASQTLVQNLCGSEWS